MDVRFKSEFINPCFHCTQSSFHLSVVKLIVLHLLHHTIDLKKNWRHFFIQSDVNQLWLVRTRFPALYVSYMYFLWFLIGSLYCLCPLWLARVISLVLVLRPHSIENCSKKLHHWIERTFPNYYSCWLWHYSICSAVLMCTTWCCSSVEPFMP